MAKSYQEIIRLHDKLDEAGIPHEFEPYMGGYHIVYNEDGKRVCSAIEHDFSYGHECDTIEIMGLLTPEERVRDDVVGYLTADDVFNRIKTSNDEYLRNSRASCTILGAGGEVWKGSMPMWD